MKGERAMREKSSVADIDKTKSSAMPAPSSENACYENKDDYRNTMHTSGGVFGEEKLVQFVVFSLGDEEFGVDIEQVSEIVRSGRFSPIPDSPKFIRGLTNVRGTIIAVIDLKKRFVLREENDVEGKHIIITREQKNLLGILVDEVTEVLRVAQKEIRPAPGMTTVIHKKYMTGVIIVDDRMIILLDLKSVLSEEELEKLARLRDENLERKGRSSKRKTKDETDEKDETLEIEDRSSKKIIADRKEVGNEEIPAVETTIEKQKGEIQREQSNDTRTTEEP
jgi:purine-binding chemotaxis protein CheW